MESLRESYNRSPSIVGWKGGDSCNASKAGRQCGVDGAEAGQAQGPVVGVGKFAPGQRQTDHIVTYDGP